MKKIQPNKESFNKDAYIKAFERNYSGKATFNYDLRFFNVKVLNSERNGYLNEKQIYDAAKKDVKGILEEETPYISQSLARSDIKDSPESDVIRQDVFYNVIQPLCWALENPNEPLAKEIIKLQKSLEKTGKEPKQIDKSSKIRKATQKVALNIMNRKRQNTKLKSGQIKQKGMDR
ncbi:MAG: hypothetical protein IJL05_04790 [Alphaproteobacteria bacterium]|nr:hypothetical protein [Alphaproteobacteria bacterium]